MIDDDLNAQIGAAVRTARMARGVTQDDLARLLGVDRVTVSRYEGGKRTLPAPALVRIATYLEIPVNHLTPGPSPQIPDMEQTAIVLQPTAQTTSARSEAVQTVVRVLEEHPELVATVLDLLETLLEHEQGTAV